jgi:hypothetical protein
MWGRSDLRPRVCRPLAPGHEARQGQQRPWFLGWELRSGLAHRAGLAHRWDRQAFGPPVAGLDPPQRPRPGPHRPLPLWPKMQSQQLLREKIS